MREQSTISAYAPRGRLANEILSRDGERSVDEMSPWVARSDAERSANEMLLQCGAHSPNENYSVDEARLAVTQQRHET